MSNLLDESVKRMGSKQFLRFAEARKFVHSLGLKSQIEWRTYRASGKKPSNIPSNPHTYYGNEWAGHGDWLGTGRLGSRNRQFLSFKEARKVVRSLGLKSYDDWEAYCASGRRPSNIPSNPRQFYGNEWVGYSDFLGTGKPSGNREFLPFKEAREFVRTLGLKSLAEWSAYCTSGNKPHNIPAAAHRLYGNEWAGWGDFLGTARIANKNRKFLPFKQARKFVRSLGLKTSEGWNAYCQSGPKA